MDKPQLFNAVNASLTDLVKRITTEQLTLVMPEYATYEPPTDVRKFLNILCYENMCVPKVLAGERDLANNQEFKEDLLGDDFQASYARYAAEAEKAVNEHDDWQRVVQISYGEFPAESYITDIVIQRATSLVDLAGMIGAKPVMDEIVTKQVWALADQYAPTLREYGVFPAPIDVPADAPLIDRLQGLMGRKPV